MQRVRLGLFIFLMLASFSTAAERPLDPTSFVAVGGGWTAGFSDSRLAADYQRYCYPALLAERMSTIMPLPRIRSMASPPVAGVDLLPGIAPPVSQSVLRSLPFPIFTFNPSVPFLSVSESLRLRPGLPIQQEGNLKQTLVNLIVGYPLLILDEPPLWTQIEYVERMRPTLVVWQPGEGDLLPAVLSRDPFGVTSLSAFSADLAEAAGRLRKTYAEVVVMNLPDPLDAAFFSTLDEVAGRYQVTTGELGAIFDLSPGDLITMVGLVEIGDFYRGRGDGSLSSTAFVSAAEVALFRSRLAGLNAAVEAVAGDQGFQLFDLYGFAREVRQIGIAAGPIVLDGGYAGGFYSPDGLFPSPSGQAVLADRLITFINQVFGTSYGAIDIEAIVEEDPFLGDRSGPGASQERVRRALAVTRGREQHGRLP